MTTNDLIDWRQSMGLTQEEFSGLLGIPVGTLRGWEIGRRTPAEAVSQYLRLAEWLQIHHSQVFMDWAKLVRGIGLREI